MVNGPGVVTGRSGTIGRVHFVEGDFWPHNTTLWVTSFSKVTPKFAYYLLLYVGLDRFSSGSGVPTLNRNDAHAFHVAIPSSKAEQGAIATALADGDGLISALERLISKKVAVKQGMMQQLLTGEVRLPGFTEPWCESTVSDLAQIVSGGTPKSSVPAYWDGGIAWCTPTDITGEPGRYLHRTERTISRAGLEGSAASLLPEGSILLCTRATIGALKIAARPIATNQGFKSLIPRPGVSSEFLYYKLSTLRDLLAGRGTGSTFLEVSTRDVAGLRIEAPRSEEQTAIGRVLADIDDQIDALESRLSKVRAIKQGMMQELLSGRTRLPVREAVAA